MIAIKVIVGASPVTIYHHARLHCDAWDPIQPGLNSHAPEQEVFHRGAFESRGSRTWIRAHCLTQRGGYRIDDDGTSQSRRRMGTTWKIELAPRKGDGRRTRRFAEFEPVQGETNQWRARVSTVVQVNMDLDNPLDATRAEWRKADPDVDDAERVLWTIEARFREFGPSKDFEIK